MLHLGIPKRIRVGQPILLWLTLLTVGPGCSGWLDYENSSTAVVLEGMGAQCTSDWSGPLPQDFCERFNDAITRSFAEMEYQVSSEIETKGITEVDSVRLRELVLRTGDVGDPRTSQNTLGFVSEIRIYVVSKKSGTNLPQMLLAEHSAVPPTATAVILEPTKVNLVPYHKEGMELVAEVVPRTCLAADLELRFTYQVVIRYLPQ